MGNHTVETILYRTVVLENKLETIVYTYDQLGTEIIETEDSMILHVNNEGARI